MALASTNVWELRSVGSDQSGGGYNPSRSGTSTDRSQADTPFRSGTALVVDASTNTDVAPDGYTPDATADPGNIIQVTAGAGFTPGFYEIVSVVSGKWRLDRSPAATGTGGGIWALGGALATWAKALGGAQFGGGNTLWVKSGTYTITITLGPNNSTPTRYVIGYGTTRGDAGPRPLLTTATSSLNLITTAGVGSLHFSRIAFSNTASTRWSCLNATGGGALNYRFSSCTFDGFNAAIYGSFAAGYTFSGVIDNCEFKNQFGVGDYVYLGGPCLIIGNHFHNVSTAINQDNITQGGPIQVIGNVFSSNARDIVFNVSLTNGPSVSVIGNAFYGTANDGVKCLTLFSVPPYIIDNVFVGLGGYGINWSAGSSSVQQWCVQNNAFYNCALGNYNGIPAINQQGSILLTGDPFVNAAGNDFTLNGLPGRGAAVTGAGWPSTVGTLTQANRPNVGAYQSNSAGGGASAYAY